LENKYFIEGTRPLSRAYSEPVLKRLQVCNLQLECDDPGERYVDHLHHPVPAWGFARVLL